MHDLLSMVQNEVVTAKAVRARVGHTHDGDRGGEKVIFVHSAVYIYSMLNVD